MGINKRAGFLVKLCGLGFLLCLLSVLVCPSISSAQSQDSGSASIKAPKNLKKSKSNQSNNKDEGSDKSDNTEPKQPSSDNNDNQKKETTNADNQSDNSTVAGSPFGAFIPPDRVHWQHPNNNQEQSSIKQNTTNTVKPVEKTKVAPVKVKPVQKVAEPPKKNIKTNNVKTVKPQARKTSSKNNTVESNSSINEELIIQEEPIEDTITTPEISSKPDTSSNLNQLKEKEQPDTTSDNSLSVVEPQKSVDENIDNNSNSAGIITTPPSNEIDNSNNSDHNKNSSSFNSPGLDESTQLDYGEEENNTKTSNNLITTDMQDILKAIGYLLLVLSLLTILWIVAKWLTGFRETSSFSHKAKILHQMDLGMNQKLKLIQSGNMVLVLGVSPNGIQLFDKFPIDELDTHDWSSAVNLKIKNKEDLHIPPTEPMSTPKPTTRINPEATTRVSQPQPSQEDTYLSASKGKSYTFRGGKLVEKSEYTEHSPTSHTAAQEKLISQIRSKVKQWDL